MAQCYSVEGGVVGVDNLESQDVHLAEDFGARVHSERLQAFNITVSSGNVAQTLPWDITAGGIPDSINRVLGVFVTLSELGDVLFCQLSVQNSIDAGDGDQIIWAWDKAIDATMNARVHTGGGIQDTLVLVPSIQQTPFMLIRQGAEKQMPQFVWRGTTDTFGAGTVNCVARVYIARPDEGNPPAGNPSSHGLPIPGW